MKKTPIPPTATANLVRRLLMEKHGLIHTKAFMQVVVALGTHMDDIEAEWAATQPTMELADQYVSAQLAHLEKVKAEFRAVQAAHEIKRRAIAMEITRLAASL